MTRNSIQSSQMRVCNSLRKLQGVLVESSWDLRLQNSRGHELCLGILEQISRKLPISSIVLGPHVSLLLKIFLPFIQPCV